MKYLKDFSGWTISEDTPYGGGSREKNWIENTDIREKGLFKYPKINPGENLITGEYWAEDLAVEIAKEIGVSCAEVDMGIFDNKIGSISYLLTNEKELLFEGVQYISKKYPTYDQDEFVDVSSNKSYSIGMILNSIKDTGFIKEFLTVPLFDCLIGNSDRHSSNWGIILDSATNKERFSPLYDNGSALTCYVNEKDIINILRDENRFEALANRRSLSIIRWDIHKRPTHLQLIAYLKKYYYDETYEMMNNISRLNINKIERILNKYPDEIISQNRKLLIKKFLKYKVEKMTEIYFK